jgi:hypothetical protein
VALSGTQRHSAAPSSTQWHSAALSAHRVHGIRPCQLPLRSAFPSPRLLLLGAPTEVDLELISDASQPLSASRFGSALRQAASNISSDLLPAHFLGQGAVGAMDVIVRWLNSQSKADLAGWLRDRQVAEHWLEYGRSPHE